MIFLQLCCLILLFSRKSYGIPEQPEINVFTVATHNNHGLERFLRSAKVFGINVEVLGMGKKWVGGNMEHPGGGQKINLLKEKLKSLKKLEDKDRIILFTDSFDVMFLANLKEIVDKFTNMYVRVLFSAEPFCWPDSTLSSKYPDTSMTNAFLNSGGFIGYYSDIMAILNYKQVRNNDDDQLYYTMVYLDEEYRLKHRIALDHDSKIFQNLNGALSDVELISNSTEDFPYIKNVVSNERPLIVHGNGPSKLKLNQFSNYLAKAWSLSKGCTMCDEKRTVLKDDALPNVLMAVFIEQPTPFLEEFLDQIEQVDYPKNKIHLFIHNNVEYHEEDIDKFYKTSRKNYLSAKRIKPSDFMSEAEARNVAKDRCAGSACEYVFSIDSLSRVEPATLRYLLSSGYDVIAPLLVRSGQAWSNFWGAINTSGFYARSFDYLDIVNGNIKGIWNVPFITNCYLMKISIFRDAYAKGVTYVKEDQDADMAFCSSLRSKGIMMYVSNEKAFGHLVNPETFDTTRTNPDVYQVIENKVEWEERYLSPEYLSNFEEGRNHSMPCPDVYWFPIVSARFCKEWIEVMEAYGKWSDGTNNDKRLEGGYEAVPTRDIHMKQVHLERQWLHILKEYVRPLQELIFTGYYHNLEIATLHNKLKTISDKYECAQRQIAEHISSMDELLKPPVSVMNFVVRYRPDEQPSLRPHHDSSTYTINIALNTPYDDYEGGGCRFIRYNCSVRDTKRGWMLMHPGRLTHFHEGLLVTKGTRYIMISFVDP